MLQGLAIVGASLLVVPRLVRAVNFDEELLKVALETEICPQFDDPQNAVEILKQKRIRKNLLKMDAAEWEKYAAALNVMKTTPTEAGKAQYGEGYRDYDWFVCQHARATVDPRGDFAHLNVHFFTWHRAYEIRFEQVLLMIDSSLSGTPYLDFRDIVADPANSKIFSDEMYGDFIGDEANDYQLTLGKFKDWKIATIVESDAGVNEVVCPDVTANMYGQLRSHTNPSKGERIVRMGGQVCNTPQPIGDDTALASCMTEMKEEMKKMYDCQFNGLHLFPHFGIGGTRPIDPTHPLQMGAPWPLCVFVLAEGQPSPTGLVQTIPNPIYGCYDCPTGEQVETCRRGEEAIFTDCVCHPNTDVCTMHDGFEATIMVDSSMAHYYGDMIDITTSPNDPLFFPMHIGIDRFAMFWTLINPDAKKDYWHFPTSGNGNPGEGGNLDDPLRPEDMFDGMFGNGGYPNNDCAALPDKSTSFTHRDIFDATEILQSPYTYDSMIEVLSMCIPDDDEDDPEDDIPDYVIVERRRRWKWANRYCRRRFGTQLATVSSLEHQQKIEAELRKEGVTRAWIGLSDRKREGSFEWSEGSIPLAGYTNWGRGQPSKRGRVGRKYRYYNRQDCVSMNGRHRYEWFDRRCGRRKKFVCNAPKTEQAIEWGEKEEAEFDAWENRMEQNEQSFAGASLGVAGVTVVGLLLAAGLVMCVWTCVRGRVAVGEAKKLRGDEERRQGYGSTA